MVVPDLFRTHFDMGAKRRFCGREMSQFPFGQAKKPVRVCQQMGRQSVGPVDRLAQLVTGGDIVAGFKCHFRAIDPCLAHPFRIACLGSRYRALANSGAALGPAREPQLLAQIGIDPDKYGVQRREVGFGIFPCRIEMFYGPAIFAPAADRLGHLEVEWHERRWKIGKSRVDRHGQLVDHGTKVGIEFFGSIRVTR